MGAPSVSFLLLASLLPASLALQLQPLARTTSAVACRHSAVRCGLFDMFQESEESKRAKDEAFKAQQAMLARRRDPEAMAKYEADVAERRSEIAQKGSELIELQLRDNKDGEDGLEAWKQLKAEGKVLSSHDMERDADSARMGSEGLIAQRIDTNLPYTDQGYVADDQPDFMEEASKAFGKLFGGKKE